jgi:hypothetical protein
MLCRSENLSASNPWNCTMMVKPIGRGGAAGPGDGAVFPVRQGRGAEGFPSITILKVRPLSVRFFYIPF